LNLLSIGWASLNPVSVPENGTILLIHARLKEDYRISHFTFSDSHFKSDDLSAKSETRNVKSEIRFTLNDNTISELADGDGNVIDGLKLFIPDAGGNDDVANWGIVEMIVYPNPTNSTLTIDLETINPEPSKLSLDLINIHGIAVMKPQAETIVSGWHHRRLDLNQLVPGVYFLRANVGGEIQMKKVVISR
jgi:hypothetical protein